jgi:organic hydroperoxide reductase OsmC/OhrA
MSHHHATIAWSRGATDFGYEAYDRGHTVTFGSGQALRGSAAQEFRGDPSLANPEEAYVAALSACHMLTFLAIASRKRLVVDAYDDDASGVLEKDAGGKLSVTRVTLRPRVRFAPGTIVDADTFARIHHLSHEECFIARSVKTEIAVEAEIVA